MRIAFLVPFLFATTLYAADDQRRPSFTLRVPEMNLVVGGFHSVSGLSMENEVVEYRDGSGTGVTRKVPGTLKWGDITLKRGIVADKSLWIWKSASNEDPATSHNGSIVMYDWRGTEVGQWHFENAWPIKVEYGAGCENDIAIESITIAVETITRQ